MRKLLFLLTVLILLSTNVFPGTVGSSSSYSTKLYYTAKTWGFVKYFHSEVAAGNVDWDQVLTSTLSEITAQMSDAEFNGLLLHMIHQAGTMPIPTSDPVYVPDDLKYNLDTIWMYDPIFSDSVLNALDSIQADFRPQDHCLVGEAFVNGNPVFINDSSGYQLAEKYPDKAHRLLALFRYWNIINYFYPYKYIIDQNWDSTLVEFIPKFVDAANANEYHLAFLELATRINDSHAYALSEEINENIIGEYYLPLKLKFVENETVIMAAYGTQDIKAGDILRAVNGQDIHSYRDSLKKYIAASNKAAFERNINYRILRGQKEHVQLTIENQTGQKNISLYREFTYSEYADIFAKSGPVWEILTMDSVNFGYVDMGRLEIEQVDTMFSELWNTDAIIFDVRNYPKGTMWYMVKYLFDAPLHIAKFTVPSIRYPGTLYWSDAYIPIGLVAETYNNPIYILFDELTQSQAEYTVMALEQHPKSVKIGSQTAGADGNVSIIYLPGGIKTYFTGLGVFYPDKTETQRKGIIPDIEVHPTIAGIRAGEDEVLEAALKNTTGMHDHGPQIKTPAIYLYQNYPNPFNPRTTIRYRLQGSGFVQLYIYNLLGQKVDTLVYKKQTQGMHEVLWDASGFPSGLYYYRLSTDQGFSQIRKLLLLK